MALLALVGVWLVVALTHLGFFAFEDDEGTFLVTAQAVWEGHPLYREVWFNYFSGLMNLLQLAFALGGVGIIGPRVIMVLLAAGTMLVAGGIAQRAYGRSAGLFAVLLLILLPASSRMGRSVMAEVPAAFCGALAIYMFQRYDESDRLSWLTLSGLLAGLGAWFKYPTALLVVVLLVGLWLTNRRKGYGLEAMARRTTLLVPAAVLPVAIDTLAYGVDPQWGQIMGTYALSAEHYDTNVLRSLDDFRDYFDVNGWGLAALAVAGQVVLWRKHRRHAWLIGAWLLLYFVSMLFSSPLGSHHIYLLLVPLCVTGGASLAELFHLVRGDRDQCHAHRGELAGLGVAAAVLLVFLPHSLGNTAALYRSDEQTLASEYAAVSAVADYTLPGDYVLADLPMITFRAGRSAPPRLTNTSGMRFTTGMLTDEMVQKVVASTEPAAIVLWEDKFVENAPSFVDDTQSTYVTVLRKDTLLENDLVRLRRVYVRSDRAEPSE